MLGYRGEKLRVIGVRTCVRRQPLARWFLWLEKKKKGSITVAYPYPDLSLPWWRTPRPIPPFTLGESSKDHGKFHFSLINGQKKYIANCVFFSLSLAVTGIRVIFSAFESRFFCRFLKSIGYPIDERASMKIRKTYRFHRFQRLLFCLPFFFFYDRWLEIFIGYFYRIPRIAGIEFISNGMYTAAKNRLSRIFCSNSNIENLERGRFHRFLSPIWYFRVLHVIFDIAAAILGRTF